MKKKVAKKYKVKKMEEDFSKYISLGIKTLIGIFFIILIFSSIYTVQSGEQGILLTWGRAEPGSIQPGLHFKIPIAQSVVKFDTRTQTLGIDAAANSYDTASSKDLQIVKVNTQVNYRLQADKVPEIYTNVGSAYEDKVMYPTLHDTIKAVTAQYTAEELVTKREEVRSKAQDLYAQKMKQYNILIEQLNIVKFDFSEQFNIAIEAKVTAEQNKLKAENDLKRIQVEAQQQIAIAQGQRDAAIAQATGEAEKVKLVQEQLMRSPQYIEYIKAQKWDGHLPIQFTGTGVLPFVNVATLIANNQTN